MAHKNNEQNLKPRTTLSKEEAKEMGRKGGIASGKARRERKNMREQMQMLLNLKMNEGKTKKKIKDLGIEDTEINNQMALIYSLYSQALDGNTRAFEIVQGMTEDKSVQEMPEINIKITDNSNLQEELFKKKGAN